jgi:hypothetical protein
MTAPYPHERINIGYSCDAYFEPRDVVSDGDLHCNPPTTFTRNVRLPGQSGTSLVEYEIVDNPVQATPPRMGTRQSGGRCVGTKLAIWATAQSGTTNANLCVLVLSHLGLSHFVGGRQKFHQNQWRRLNQDTQSGRLDSADLCEI